MDDALSQRQLEILDVIASAVRARGFPPSIREIGERVGLTSSATVHGHLRHLEQRGFIKRDPARPRSIEVVRPEAAPSAVAADLSGVLEYPVLSDPSDASSETARLALSRSMVGSDEAFLFEVQGESMRDSGIMHRDLVIVRRAAAAEDGDVVVIRANHEISVKRYYHAGDKIRLQPDNERMKPIVVREAEVLGKVVGVLRTRVF
jgi:repressor LexA